MITDVRDVSTAKLKCKSRLPGHRWVLTGAPLSMFQKARRGGGSLITFRCDFCKGWRYRRIHRRTAEWLDPSWKYVSADSYKTHGLDTRDFRKELLRRGFNEVSKKRAAAPGNVVPIRGKAAG